MVSTEDADAGRPAHPEIVVARTPEHFRAARRLIEAYVAALDVELDFQDYDVEIKELEVRYGEPRGRLLLARVVRPPGDPAASPDVDGIGCVALQRQATDACEMKRLYVEPAARGAGVGELLVAAILREARSMGFSRMLLDTLPGMEAAQELYLRFGFRERGPYRHNPVAGARFMEARLDEGDHVEAPAVDGVSGE